MAITTELNRKEFFYSKPEYKNSVCSYLKDFFNYFFKRKFEVLNLESHIFYSKCATEINYTQKLSFKKIEQKNYKKYLSKKYIPFKLDNSSEIVFVKYNELCQKLGNVQAEVFFKNSKDSENNIDQIVLKNLKQIKIDYQRETSIKHRVKTLNEKLNIPVDLKISYEADLCYSAYKIKHADLSFCSSDKFALARMSGSNSIKTIGGKSISDWQAADSYVRNAALKKAPITIDFLCNINKMLLENTNEKELEGTPGNIRGPNENVTGGGIGAPAFAPGAYAESSTKEIIDWINCRLAECDQEKFNPIVLAGLAYQKLISVHPFNDGNGRTCRFIMDYILQRYDMLPPVLEEITVTIFGDQPYKSEEVEKYSSTPTRAVQAVIEGLEKSYERNRSQIILTKNN